MKFWISIAFIFILKLFVAQQYNFQKYSIEDGLPRSAVYSLMQDYDGFLWIGLDGGGIAVFDGKSFQTFDISNGLPSHDVRDIFQAKDSTIWIATANGLCHYNYDTIKVYNENDGLCDNYTRSITQDNEGNIWVGTNNGLSIFDGERFKSYNIHDGLLDYKVRIVFKDSKGNIWVGTDSGINFLSKDGTKFNDFIYNYYLPQPTVIEIYEDDKHNIWIGTVNGVMQYKDNSFKTYTVDDGLVSNRVRAIAQDIHGNIWLGTRSGVSKFDGVSFHNFHQGNGLSHDRIRDIILDNDGNLWFATYFGGIDKFSDKDWITYTEKEGIISNQVFSIFEDELGHIVLGTFEGISKLYTKKGMLDTVKNITNIKGKLIDDRVYTVFKDQNGWYWYGTHDGIVFTNNNEIREITKKDGLVDNEINTILSVSKNIYWIGTEDGMSKITFSEFPNQYTIQNFNEKNHELAGNDISTIQKDGFGNTWFGFRNGSISIQLPNGNFIQPTLPDNIVNITSIHKGNDNYIWIGTDANGLFRIQNTGDYSKVISAMNYSVKDGLISDHIYALVSDNENNIWIGTEKGVNRIIFDSKKHIERVDYFGKKEGLKGIEINENAAFVDHNGNLWFGTVEGVSYLNISNLTKNEIPPRIYISKLFINNEQVNKSNKNYQFERKGKYQLPISPTLNPNQNTIEFSFIGINFNSPDKVLYSYILEGFDKEWSAPNKNNWAKYTNLPPGNYTFKIKAQNEDGIWNEPPAEFTFSITPPFWKTTWFLILCGISGVLIFIGISQWRVNRLKSAKQKLEKEVALATQKLREEKEHVEEQNKEIEEQKNQLAESNAAITDSINYAQRIQKAVMNPSLSSNSDLLKRMFIFHKPKDIVSGDFYWFKTKGNYSFVSAVDCTGHGVPGAFMSMIGITFLNQIINTTDLNLPNEILFELREQIINALKNEGGDKSKDGMDMAFITIDWKNHKIYFSGANNPLYIVRDGTLIEFKPDKMPIGEHDRKNEEFTLHEIQIQEGDMIYLISDGFPDQFGGPKGKKYKYKALKFYFESIYDFPIEKQKEALQNELERWKGDYEQIDDILIMGVKF